MRLMLRFSLLVLILLLGLLAAAALRTLLLPEPRPTGLGYRPVTDPDPGLLARHLAGALQFHTAWGEEDAGVTTAELQAQQTYLAQAYPGVHALMEREKVNDLSLLYTWRGSDPAAPALLLTAHQDVVPISPGTAQNWRNPPYAGVIDEGYVWGRGALDDKASMIALLTAIEMLIEQGFQPQRTLYLAFGHDEETGGAQGAQRLAQHLQARQAAVGLVLDEGGLVTEGIFPVAGPVALVGIGEKGYLSLKLRTEGEGGHSSTPPHETAIGRLSRALVRLDDHEFPANLEYSRALNRKLATGLPWPDRLVLSNDWLFGSLIAARYRNNPATDAWIRTTIAPTVLRAGNKDNVLPAEAEAVVNFRLLPGMTREQLLEEVAQLINDPEVQLIVDETTSTEASAISPVDSTAYRVLERSIYESLSEAGAIVGPYVVLGATDARHYQALSPNIYRFAMIRVSDADIPRFHGTDERIAVSALSELVQFYQRLILNYQQTDAVPARD